MSEISAITVDLDGKYWYMNPEGGPSIGPFDTWKEANTEWIAHLLRWKNSCPTGGCEE